MDGFFSHYPRFLQTSATGANEDRLNRRHAFIIERHAHFLSGARVLDIASHDGRWGFAALKAGAAHVTGVEVRPHLVKAALENFVAYNIPKDQYEFIAQDFFEAAGLLAQRKFDTVLCLGFLYHTLRYAELFRAIRAWDAKALIIDTAVIPTVLPGAYVRLRREEANVEGNGILEQGAAFDEALVGVPTVDAVVTLMSYFGYSGSIVEWQDGKEDFSGVTDYAKGERATIVGIRR